MNYLNAVFWDYPEFTHPEILRQHLQDGDQRVYHWILKRFLEHGRVVDTLKFFPLETIVRELSQLSLTPYTYKKWKRIGEVYGHASGK